MNRDQKVENCKNLIKQLLRKNLSIDLAKKNYDRKIFDEAKKQLTPQIIEADHAKISERRFS